MDFRKSNSSEIAAKLLIVLKRIKQIKVWTAKPRSVKSDCFAPFTVKHGKGCTCQAFVE